MKLKMMTAAVVVAGAFGAGLSAGSAVGVSAAGLRQGPVLGAGSVSGRPPVSVLVMVDDPADDPGDGGPTSWPTDL